MISKVSMNDAETQLRMCWPCFLSKKLEEKDKLHKMIYEAKKGFSFAETMN